MQEYVVVFARYRPEFVLLVHKNRPAWQAGRYNLPGGKVNEGETPLSAARRELLEETGLHSGTVVLRGKIVGSWGIVYCFDAEVEFDQPKPRAGETEEVHWHRWGDVKGTALLLPNLKVIIPLFIAGVDNWVVNDEGPSYVNGTCPSHTFAITIYQE